MPKRFLFGDAVLRRRALGISVASSNVAKQNVIHAESVLLELTRMGTQKLKAFGLQEIPRWVPGPLTKLSCVCLLVWSLIVGLPCP